MRKDIYIHTHIYANTTLQINYTSIFLKVKNFLNEWVGKKESINEAVYVVQDTVILWVFYMNDRYLGKT